MTWDKRGMGLSLVLALTALPFYVEGVVFHNVYVIVLGDAPLFVAATRIWRIRAAEKKARLIKSGLTTPPRLLDVPEPEAPSEPGVPPVVKDDTVDQSLPFEPGQSVEIRSARKQVPRITSLRLQMEKLHFNSSPDGLNKPAFRCRCDHIHVTTCMACGMTMKNAQKSGKTRWIEWETARAAGLVKDVDVSTQT
ncbi:MAG: hypothetical protein ACRD6W_10880 [Nitrososphaerales archaeon]